MTANSAKELFQVFLPTTFRSSKRTIVVLQASSVKDVACKISERSESRNQCYTTQWKISILCHLAKNGLRSNLRIFLGGGGHCKPDHTKPDSYGPVWGMKRGLIPTVAPLGRSGGIPEPPCLGSVVPEWPHTWRPPVMKKKRRTI